MDLQKSTYMTCSNIQLIFNLNKFNLQIEKKKKKNNSSACLQGRIGCSEGGGENPGGDICSIAGS